ncbi:MAG: hypothetical protein ABW090_17490 [Sedimenticola sp.]
MNDGIVMRFSSTDFQGCGFPEEYAFWAILFFSVLLVVSFVMLHLLVDEDFLKEKAWLPVVFFIFKREAFSVLGNYVRFVLLVAFLILLMLFISSYLFYEFGIYDCGVIY